MSTKTNFICLNNFFLKEENETKSYPASFNKLYVQNVSVVVLFKLGN